MRIFKGHTVYSVVYTSSRHRYIKNKKNWMTTLKFYWRRGERNEGKDAWACVCNISSSFSRRLKVSRILDTSEIHSNLKRDSAYIVNGGWCTEWKNVRYRVCVLMIRRLCSSLYSNPLETGWGGGGKKVRKLECKLWQFIQSEISRMSTTSGCRLLYVYEFPSPENIFIFLPF